MILKILLFLANTGLPYNPNTPQEVIDEVKAFKKSNKKITLFKLANEINKMDGDRHPATKFMYWQKFTWDTKNIPIGMINEMQMEKTFKSRFATLVHYLFQIIGLEKISPFYTDLMKAPDQSLEAQKEARAFFKTSDKPFLSIFAGDDPVTNGIERDVLKMAPNAISAPQIGGGHFFQWTRPKQLSKVIVNFIKA